MTIFKKVLIIALILNIFRLECVYPSGVDEECLRVPLDNSIERIISQLDTVEHTYKIAADKEKNILYRSLINSLFYNIMDYLCRINRFNWNKLDEIITDISAERIFHEGLIVDENGIYWIIKKYDNKGKNNPRREMLAYLLSRGIANFTEIMFLREGYYLTRVVISDNYKNSELADNNISQAFSSVFVASIFMRKWDSHLLNYGYINDIPMAIDHDETFNGRYYHEEGFYDFSTLFLYHSIISTLRVFCKSDYVVIGLLQEWRQIRDLLVKGMYNEAFMQMKILIQDMNYGKLLVKAQCLNEEYMKAAILKIKSIKNIKAWAQTAGYKDKDLENIVQYITDCQQSLGKDVSVIWEVLTYQQGVFEELDAREKGNASVEEAKSNRRGV